MIEAALEHLRRGGVVAAATESFFGLLADATRTDAVDVLVRLKPRGAEKGIPLLLPSREAWEKWVVALPEVARRLGAAFWPGPLTVALPARSGLDPRTLLDGRVAVRLPGPSAAAELAARFERPLTATSANFPGLPPALTDAQVRRTFSSVLPDHLIVLPGRAPGGVPSTVVVVEDDAYRVVRPGAVSEARIRAVAGVDPSDPNR